MGLRWIVVNAASRIRRRCPSYVEAIEPSAIVAVLRERPNVLPMVADIWLSFVEEDEGADP
jgi:hypothetical protein